MRVHELIGVALLAGCFGAADGGKDEEIGPAVAEPAADAGAGESAIAGERRDAAAAGGDRDGAAGEVSSGADGGSGGTEMQGAQPSADAAVQCAIGDDCEGDDLPLDDCAGLTLVELDLTQGSGRLLYLFDRSNSMEDLWNDTSRWQAAGTALANALSPFGDALSVGSLFFPSVDPDAEQICVDPTGVTCTLVPILMEQPSCLVNPITEPDQLDFRPAPQFLSAFLDMSQTRPIYAAVVGFTPLREALEEASAALAGSASATIVILTDGEPNCEWDQAIAQQTIADWRAGGMQTYVVGLPGISDTSTVLDELASAGGTSAVITPSDATELEQQLADIADASREEGLDSCVIELNPPAEVPGELRLVLREGGQYWEAARDLGGGAGWTVSADGSTAELLGGLCEAAMAGQYDQLRLEFVCGDLPPLPAP